jgi:hypothetical protein
MNNRPILKGLVMRTQRYDTDLTDEQLALVGPFLPKRKRTGPPADLREVLNAIL